MQEQAGAMIRIFGAVFLLQNPRGKFIRVCSIKKSQFAITVTLDGNVSFFSSSFCNINLAALSIIGSFPSKTIETYCIWTVFITNIYDRFRAYQKRPYSFYPLRSRWKNALRMAMQPDTRILAYQAEWGPWPQTPDALPTFRIYSHALLFPKTQTW